MNFSSVLKRWYSTHKRDMPWRQTKDPYKIWLSEVILQQTQVVQGLPYYLHFTEKYPTVFDLAKATEEDVLKLWQGLGYYSRARNLHTTAKYVAKDLNGVFPNTYKELIKLKGVGDYTASAIASICFNKPCAVVDGNVYRVLSRYFGVETPINSTKGIKEFKSLAQEVIDKKDPATHNQSIMEFGARQCKPKNPDCNSCPLNNSCFAFKENKVQLLPVKEKKVKITKKHFNFLVFLSSDGKTILEQRLGKGIWENLYQFPLIETIKEATENDILTSLKQKNYSKQIGVYLYNEKVIVHKLSHQHLYTRFWIVKTNYLNEKGIALNNIKKYPVPILISNFIETFNL